MNYIIKNISNIAFFNLSMIERKNIIKPYVSRVGAGLDII